MITVKSCTQKKFFDQENREKLLFNPLQCDKILDWSKLKTFADDNLNVRRKMVYIIDRVENIMGKSENACNIFSFSHNVFKSLFVQGHYNLVAVVW